MEDQGFGSSRVWKFKGLEVERLEIFGISGLEGRKFRVGFENQSRLGLGIEGPSEFGSESKLVLVVQGLFGVQCLAWKFKFGLEVQG